MWPRVTRSLAAAFAPLPSAAEVITRGKATVEADVRKKPRRVRSLLVMIVSLDSKLW